jgi:hypothetical protein
VKIESVKPDSVSVSIVDDANPNAPGAMHDIPRDELEQNGLTFVPATETGDEDPVQSDPGQSANTQPVSTPDIPGIHAAVTDHCPKCQYTHVTSSMTSPTTKEWECYRCTHTWKTAEEQEDVELDPETREWLEGDDEVFEVDERVLAMASAGKSRNIADIAAKDPRLQAIKATLNKEAGRKFTPREQREFIEEEGVARNSNLLDLSGTHYEVNPDHLVGARPDRVNDDYLGIGL